MARRPLLVVLLVLAGLLGLASPPALASPSRDAGPSAAEITEYWEGTWDTSAGILHFIQSGRIVLAKYRSGPGCTGRMSAKAQGSAGAYIVGTFDDRCPGGDTGKLEARLDGNVRTFVGRFCENNAAGFCGSWVRWKGTKRNP